MIQRRKNIRILIILGVLLVANVLVILVGNRSDDALDVPRNLFAYQATEEISQVLIGDDTLSYTGNYWLVNGKYKADPQRIEVLFAILKQIQVRRKASKVQTDSLNAALDQEGVDITLLSEGSTVKTFTVWGDAPKGMTWLREENGETPYLAEITGYRSYLGGIFELDANGWRYPIVLDINWQNLQKVSVDYPGEKEASFEVVFNKGNYEVEGLSATDSTRLTDFLDNLSLLYVNDFLFPSEIESFDSLFSVHEAHIVIEDVGQNKYVVDIFAKVPGREEILVRIDSSDVGLADLGRVKKLLKPRGYFEKQ